MILGIDFDGTLANTDFPTIIDVDLELIEVLKKAKNFHDLILYTCREGIYLEDAIKCLKDHGLEFDYINTQCPRDIPHSYDARKIYADYYYDDHSFNWNRDDAIKHIKSICS